jgi:hypothetical protein
MAICTKSSDFCANQGEKSQETSAVFKIFYRRVAQKAPI